MLFSIDNQCKEEADKFMAEVLAQTRLQAVRI